MIHAQPMILKKKKKDRPILLLSAGLPPFEREGVGDLSMDERVFVCVCVLRRRCGGLKT